MSDETSVSSGADVSTTKLEKENDRQLCMFEISVLKVRGNVYMVDFKFKGQQKDDTFIVSFFEDCRKHIKLIVDK